MFRRILVVYMLVCLLPSMAQASWTLNTWVKSSGGSIAVRGATPQTSVNGSVFKNYTTSQAIDVTVSPNTGYSVSQVNYNNVIMSAPSQTTYTVQGPSSQNVYATFAPQPLTVTASTGSGGSVNLTNISGINYGTKLSSAKRFTFTPSPATSRMERIDGVPAGATVSHALPAAANTPVTVTLPAGFTFTSNIALYGTFSGPPVAKTMPPGIVKTGTIVTLDGSPSTGIIGSYIWNQISGPGYPATKMIADNTTGVQTTFTPTVAGTYTFSLMVTGGSTAITTITVTDNLVGATRSQCQNCHAGNGIGTAQNVFSNWSASSHKTGFVTCTQCHIGTNTGGHPGNLTGGTVSEATFDYNSGYGSGNFCITCHNPSIITDFAASTHPSGAASCSFCHAGGVHNPAAACVNCHKPGNMTWPPAGLDFHTDYTGTNLCTNCHKLHNPGSVTGMSGPTHYNNITSAGYPASYVTSKAVCTNCHVSNALNKTIRFQWNRSGHAATTALPWTEYDFKTRSGCVQCHTTTGFIAYSTGKVTSAWGVASDKTKEVLTCIGCHSDVANGIVRAVSPVKPFAADSYVNRNVGPSNICMNCHSGRNNGLSITSADFTNQAFIAPHYLAAGGILHGKGGYNFPGQTYAFYSSNTHRTIGMTNNNGTGTDGPCVACHMSAPQKHLFKAVSSANGSINKLTATTCANCHGTTLDDTTLINSKKVSFSNALDVLKLTLAYRGFNYSPDYPYFNTTDWTTFHNPTTTMGAAFNYALLLKEPGAYAHNSAYAKQLIFDSIDYLYNGTVIGSIDTALTGLVGIAITQSQADSLKAYRDSSGCSSCHANTSGSHPAHLNSGISCEVCHNTTAASKTTLVSNPTTHMNGVTDINFKNSGSAYNSSWPAPSYNATTKTCSNVACHGVSAGTFDYYFSIDGNGDAVPYSVTYGSNGSTTPAWNATPSGDSCKTCHGNPPSDGHVWHSGLHANKSSTDPYNQCQFCHPDASGANGKGTAITNNSLHANGTVDVQAGFKSSCFGCH